MTLDAPTPRATSTVLPRTLVAARVHVANPFAVLVTPIIVTSAIFGLSIAVWALTSSSSSAEGDTVRVSGSVTWLFVYMIVAGAQAMSSTFRFAMGLSLSRREYLFGTWVFFATVSAAWTVALTGLAQLERATDGWGLGATFFAPMGLGPESPPEIAAFYGTSLILSFSIGAFFAAVWMRWAGRGLVSAFVALAAVLVGGIWRLSSANAWPAIGRFLEARTDLELAALTVPLTALIALAGYAMLRRAVPRG